MRRYRWISLGIAALWLGLAGCQTAPLAPDRSAVANDLAHRVGHSISAPSPSGQVVFPPGANLDDGLTEDEAIAIALYNNAAFQELLVDLGVARGDLIQAGLLPNPEVGYFFGVSDKPFKYIFDFPIESLWLRPIRVKSAAREADRVAQRLSQAGLDLMRDVRQAYADVLLAKERIRIAGESVTLRGKIAELAEKLLNRGATSEVDFATAKIDALTAVQDAARIAFEVPVAEEKLRNLLGLGSLRCPLTLDAAPAPACGTFDIDALTADALCTRPDALAAAQAVAAADARVKFAKLGWVRFLGILDATSGVNGHEFGPAVRMTLPIFSRNQGGIARAEAELDRAVRNRQTVANQIILDVQRSYLLYRQAGAELEVLRTKIRPEVDASIRRSQAAYEKGSVAILIVLESTRQLLDNYLRDAILTTDLRRTWAELERSVGKRLPQPIPIATPTTVTKKAP